MLGLLIKKYLRMLRRKYYWKFRRKYIEESLKNRKGECLQCGCCSTCMPPCIHYDYATRKYKIYNTAPSQCKLFPFDEKDKTEYSQIYCGYYWEENSENIENE
jgi:hypothetical protein